MGGYLYGFYSACISDCIRTGRWGAHQNLLFIFVAIYQLDTNPHLLPGSFCHGLRHLGSVMLGGYLNFDRQRLGRTRQHGRGVLCIYSLRQPYNGTCFPHSLSFPSGISRIRDSQLTFRICHFIGTVEIRPALETFTLDKRPTTYRTLSGYPEVSLSHLALIHYQALINCPFFFRPRDSVEIYQGTVLILGSLAHITKTFILSICFNSYTPDIVVIGFLPFMCHSGLQKEELVYN
jgi:hypothetical protein